MKIKLKRRDLNRGFVLFLTVRCDPKYGKNREIAVRGEFDSFVSEEHKLIPQSQFKNFGIAPGLVWDIQHLICFIDNYLCKICYEELLQYSFLCTSNRILCNKEWNFFFIIKEAFFSFYILIKDGFLSNYMI